MAHVVFVVSSVCTQWLHTDLLQHVVAVRSDTAGRILFAAFLGRPGLVFALNVLFWIATIRSLDSDGFPGAPLDSTALLAFLCSLVSQTWMENEARAVVSAMMSASSEAAVQDLLGIVCDAVVVLDEHLVMASSSPKFDALLLRRASQNACDEGPFPSRFQVTDQDRIVQFLSGSGGVAQSLFASLMDASGFCVGVQLFHKRFEDIFGQTRHVIGILEELDGADQWQPSRSSSKRQASRNSVSHEAEGGEVPNVGSSGSGSGSSTDRSVDFVPFRNARRGHTLELQIDTTSPNLQILSCTVPVTTVIGPVEDGMGLVDLVGRREVARFLRWVEEGGTAPTRVKLRHSSIQCLRHRATCVFVDDGQDPAARLLHLSELRSNMDPSALQSPQGTERVIRRTMSL